MRLFLTALLLMFASLLHAEEEPLDPEVAFPFTARVIDANTLEAHFAIVPGYYLYKDKIRFEADGAKLGKPVMPPAEVKDDAAFGRVETYHGNLRIRIPMQTTGNAKQVTLKAFYQGCADIGLCYPPQESSIVLRPLTASAPPSTDRNAVQPEAPAAEPGLFSRLKGLTGGLGGSASGEPLPVDEAFQVAVESTGAQTVTVRFSITPGHYLYRDKIAIQVISPTGVTLSGLNLPKADEKDDPSFGKTYVYHQSFSVDAQLAGLPQTSVPVSIQVSYQGCSEAGICYPPIEKDFTLDADGAASTPATPAVGATTADDSEEGKISKLLQGGSFWLIIGTFFLLGLGLSLTPCVFPMIPILSGIIVGEGHQVTRGRGFALSLAYVLGMAITYALAGVAAGLSGTLISNALQNPVALGIGAGIFVLLALSMFGFYDLQMPSFLQSRLTETSNRIKGGKLTGVFVMGALSALIVGPCVAAPLAGALVYIGQTGDVVLGGVSLFALSLGMGVPLLLIGLSAGTLLPRAGAWMQGVKNFFGVLLLGVAIWLISPLISDVTYMLLWAALLVISAIYLRAIDPLDHNATGWHRFWKGIGLIALVTGIALLLGALGGGRDILQPLSVYQGGTASAAETKHLAFKRVKNLAELDQAIAAAQGKFVMLDFYADWCVSCKEMERLTFTDPRVQARLKEVVLLQADVTANSADDDALRKRFKVPGPPAFVFFDPQGKEVSFRVVGYQPPDKFLASLEQALK